MREIRNSIWNVLYVQAEERVWSVIDSLDLSRYNIYWMFFKVAVIMIINKVKILFNYIYNICRYITI